MKEEIAHKEITSYNNIIQFKKKNRNTFLQIRRQVRKSSDKNGATSR